MFITLLAAATLAADPPRIAVVPHAPPASASVPETTAAARDAFRTWLAAENAQCANAAQVARRRLTKLRFDALHAPMYAVIGEQAARDALGHVITNDRTAILFPDCPEPAAIDQRMTAFETAVGRLTALVSGPMMPFRPAD